MPEARYEEYPRFVDDLPFKLYPEISVTSEIYSHEANWHENPEIQLCIKGEGFVLLDDDRVSFEKGDVVAVNPNVLHRTGTKSSLKYACLIIDSAFLRQMGIDPLSVGFSKMIKDPAISRSFCRLIEEYKNTGVCRIAKLNELLLHILIELREKYSSSESSFPAKRSFEPVKDAIIYIRANFAKKLTLDEISKNVLMNKYSLSREFKRMTGSTVVQYINSYRCARAAEHISDGTSVSDAARLCGFCNMSFFTKTFKAYTGKSPSEYKIKRTP